MTKLTKRSAKHTGATLISYVTIYRDYPWFSIPCLAVGLAGIVMGCLAGLLNILALLDVFAHAEAELESSVQPEQSVLSRLQSGT